jgi:FtsZ-binding cell division protein ZapB
MNSGRGGAREKAGRKSSWVSGCRQEDTKLIRVPKKLVEQLNKIAHNLDAGELIDLDTKSIKEENERLKQEIDMLKQQLSQVSDEAKRLKNEQESRSGQLELFSMNSLTQPLIPALPSKEVLVKMRDHCLKKLPAGKQSNQYAEARKIFNEFIDNLVSGKY